MIFPVLEDLANQFPGITPEQDKLPTPCDDFDVSTLRRHLLGWLTYFDAAFTDPSGSDRPDPSAFTGPDDRGAVIAHLTTTIRSALAGGLATATVNVPLLGGAYPGSVVIDLLLIETLGHGWDLARATGQRWNPDPQTCQHALTVLEGVIQPEYRGPGMPFGPEIAIDASAPPLDRLVAFTGRDPEWAPPVQLR
ncbi:TIGR03086 family metal-binding protein [Streptomyces avermitilis]|uniref:TIGR03086 family metal-binding protein n=1 Tax=Streptomyces avermitilis TaxID=33903 RepID=UPI0036CD95CC